MVLLCLVAALAGPGLSSVLRAQAPPEPVTWSVATYPAGGVVRPGGRLTLVVTATIDEGWHVYGTEELPGGPRPLRVTLSPGQPYAASGLQAPDAARDFDSAFGQVITFYDKSTSFRLPVTVPAKAAPGKRTIAIEVAYQACDGRICLPSRTARLSAPIDIKPVRRK